ncbi:fungal-specific transcription factor domain-containing protein [Exophiala viscosa]|uniref:fungal-specific transcription factor domain-containing protein n=1 Tax=Exophiala viscosa TaxID=2486360 RepID=UPI002199243A|nr:fungal-specific transcription factor domain-containing protein [Exophiala viscosa]
MTPSTSNPSPSVGHATPPAVPSAATSTTAINGSESNNTPEERPTHTSEIGTLKKLPNHGTAWLGSSSGVYFVNTVRRAFSAAFASSNLAGPNAVPASEDILTGEDAEGRSYNGPVHEGPSETDSFPQLLASTFGKPPQRKIAFELVTSFFRLWHPLFPFLHGPTFLKDMETIYQQRRRPSKPTKENPTPTDLRKLLTFQLIINIASLDRSDILLPMESRIRSIGDVSRVAGCLALSHDITNIQAILAAELYLCATLAIRQASTVAGILIKLIHHAGLHRCPLRYAQLSLEECEIRKRIFWSAYALDRHCNLSLGDPNIIQDDDIDVCLSGPELHKAVVQQTVPQPDGDCGNSMPPPRVVPDDPRVAQQNSDGPEAREKRLREAALTAYVQWAKLTGQIIEVFHKSINHRFPKHEQILRLTSDIETWWNDLPGFLTGESDHSGQDAEPSENNGATNKQTSSSSNPPSFLPPQQHLSSFFKVLYHRLLLLVNRPRLSLDQSTPEFQHGLQVCIRASRGIVAGLKSHRSHGQSMFLPGLLSAVWMSGLIIAFACQLGKYAKARALSDVQTCLSLLESMNTRWYTVQNCHKVLNLLLVNIQSRKASINGFLTVPKPEQSPQSIPPELDQAQQPAKKRQRTGLEDASPRKSSMTESASSSPVHPQLSNSGHARLKHQQTSTSGSTPNWPASMSYDASNPSALTNQGGSMPNFDFSNWDRGQPTTQPQIDAGLGSAIYATPQDLAFAQSTMNMNLPGNNNTGMTSDANNGGNLQEYSDPMFWGNMDYNVADIFGSATWENMTGPFAPGGGMNGGWEM